MVRFYTVHKMDRKFAKTYFKVVLHAVALSKENLTSKKNDNPYMIFTTS